LAGGSTGLASTEGVAASLEENAMLRSARVLGSIALFTLQLVGCPRYEYGADGSASDSGIATDAEVAADAGGSAGSGPRADSGTPTAGGTAPAPDAGSVVDAGPGTPADASTCGSAGCAGVDLVVALPEAVQAVTFRNAIFSDDDCELFEGCAGGTGPRSLLELSFTLANVGEGALELGQPFDNPLFHASLCQHAYVIDGFFAVQVRDASGAVVADGRMSTSCIAGESGGYTCRAQGLAPDEGSAQPLGSCDYVDVTGLAAGAYTLVVTVNPDRVLPETDFGNNSAEIAFDYVPCDGTVCGAECCPAGVECVDDLCMLPDLRISEQSAAGSLWITHQSFEENSCELSEMCVNGSGRRRLLQFEGRIENLGPGDLNPGPEQNNPLYEFSECHGHYHFREFTDYRLLNLDGSVAAFGHKQSFCLIDMVQVEGVPSPAPRGTRPPPGETGCSYLSAGWADIYGVGTPCQWVDITDVSPGDYTLQLTVNPEGSVLEADSDNNVVQIPVHITEDVPCTPEPEICFDGIDQDCDDMPDEWDSDCQTCFPGDPFCEDAEQAAGNGTCATAHDIVAQVTYESWIEPDDAGEVTPECGGEGGDVFFAFTLEREQAVYLGTLGSSVDTVLALYRGDCDGERLRCEDDACSGTSSQFIDVLGPGQYLVAVKAKHSADSGPVRLKFQSADAAGAIVLDAPGVYAGDTSASDDSVQVCAYEIPPPPGGVDAGPPPSAEECVQLAEPAAGDSVTHECLHCACGIDPASVAACDATCWSLIDCVVEQCNGDGSDLNCIVSFCGDFLASAPQAQLTGPVLRMCPETCPLGGGMVGTGGGTGPRPIPDGGMGPVGPQLQPAPDDIYLVAACNQGLTVSTCGTSAFQSVIDVRSGSLDGYVQACTANYDLCDGDTLGTATNAYVAPGLTFVVVDGVDESAAGAYQMSVIY
jgi:hypothetical protein